jgi:hypothetical protein
MFLVGNADRGTRCLALGGCRMYFHDQTLYNGWFLSMSCSLSLAKKQTLEATKQEMERVGNWLNSLQQLLPGAIH